MSIIAHYAIGDKSIYFPSGFRSNYSCILQRTRRWNSGCLTGLVNNMLGCRSELNMRCQLRLAGVCQVSQTDTITTFRSASATICIPPRETLTCFCVFVCQARSTSSTQRTSGNVEKLCLGFLKNRAEYFQFINFVHIVNFVCMHLQQLIERSWKLQLKLINCWLTIYQITFESDTGTTSSTAVYDSAVSSPTGEMIS